MLFDSIQVVEGGSITNLVVASGAAFPAVADTGELFFRTDNNLLYLYAGVATGWSAIGTDASFAIVAQTGSYTDLINKPDVSGHNTGDQTITLTGDVTGSGLGSFAATLATVNSSPIADGFRKVTINAKGLVTASSAVTASDVTTALGFTPYNSTNPSAFVNAAGAAASAPVQSIAGRTGNVTLAQSDISGTYTGSISSGQVTTGLGFTPYNATNPSNFITATQAPVQSVAGRTGTVTLAQADITGLKTTDTPTFASVNAPLTGAVTGNASTATALQTGRVISISGDAAGSTAAFDGTASVTANVVLANVNSSPVTAAFQKLTVNSKGLVTATSVVSPSDITTALAYTPANKAGDTFSGAVVLAADPTQALGAATKQYVDNMAAGLVAKTAVITSTMAALPAVTYANGASGVGATLTASANGALGSVGGYSPTAGNRILVKDQASALQNGIYVVTNAGAAGAPFILTRAPEFDNTPTGEMTAGDFTYVQAGTLGGTQWVLTTPGTIAVGTDNITWSQLTGAGVVTAGTGIAVTGNQVSNTGVLSITTSSGLSTNTSATGNVSITNTGVTSLAGTSNQVTVSASTGGVTLSLPQSINVGASPTFVGTNFSAIPNAALTNSAVTLNGTAVSLGGTATITAAAGTLTGSTLAAGVTGSSLTSVGTLGSLSVTGTVTAGSFSGSLTGNVTGNVSGSAASITGVYGGSLTSSQVTTGLGFTPYNATNPSGYTTNVGTVTSVSGTGTVSGLTLSGSVTTAGSLTLGGTLSLTSANVTTALGFTPYNATNPSGYISGITSGNVTTALGFTPYNSTNPNGYITSSASISGNAATATSATNAGTVGGFTPSSTAGTASRVVVADASGYINNSYFNGTDEGTSGSAGTVTGILAKRGDNYYRTTNAASIATYISGQAMNISGSSTSCSGNAATATTATTANAVATGNNYQMNSLGIGTGPSGTAGEIRATNNITAYYSDDRLKTRTGLIENALDKVATLDAFYYHANETAQALGYDVHPEVGISAQQVQAIMPEVVAPAPIDDRYLTVRYERLVPLLIAAIKELQAEVELLKAAK